MAKEYGKRASHLEAQVKELYKIIGGYDVVRSGVVFVDTDRQQTGLFFCTGPGNEMHSFDRQSILQTEFVSNPIKSDVQNIFSMLDLVFQNGIHIGIRESLRLAKEQLAIKQKEENSRYIDIELTVEALEYLLSDISSYGLDTGIIEQVTYCYNNPEVMNFGVDDDGKYVDENGEKVGSDFYDNLVTWNLDYTKNGDGKFYDFSSDAVIDTLNMLSDAPEKTDEVYDDYSNTAGRSKSKTLRL